MPRKPRFCLAGVPLHIIQRGNNREPCFFSEQDYGVYLDSLKVASEKRECAVHAYVLMTNHVHLLITPMAEWSASEMMQSVGRRYVKYVNNTYRRTGTLWEGRFKASLIQSEQYLLICQRYIELNPVRAGMVTHPGEYPWSSYGVNGQGASSDLVDPHHEYCKLGSDVEARQSAYRDLFRCQLDPGVIDEMRHALNHELVVGNNKFKEKIRAVCQRQVDLGTPGRPKVN